MNLESMSASKHKTPKAIDFDMEDFDFKPITSGLGFNQAKTSEIKPAFSEKMNNLREAVVARPSPVRKEMNVYQNDLSLFYGQNETLSPLIKEEREEKIYRTGSKMHRSIAYVLDLLTLGSVMSVMLTLMARATEMEIMEAWTQYPDEITPLVVTLFCGFYLIYFSIFEKSGVTIGKSIMNLKLVNLNNAPLDFMNLLLRSLITLLNFVSLGLFSYFDLQNKISGSKVIKAD